MMQPLCLLSMGRSGSTYLMQLLSDLDAVVTDGRYPYETFVLNHMAKLYRVLGMCSDPGTYPKYGAPPKLVGPFPDLKDPDDVVARALAAARMATLKPCCAEYPRQVYACFAAAQAKDRATRFAEKTTHNLLRTVHELYGEVYPVFLVRNFYAILGSMVLFARTNPDVGLDRHPTVESFISNAFAPRLQVFLDVLAETPSKLVLRYEDLIADPRGSLQRVCSFAALDVSTAAIEDAVAHAEANRVASHATSDSAEASLDRYRQVLTAEQMDLVRQRFARDLADHGY